MKRDFDSEIQIKSGQLEAIFTQMEEIRQEFVEEAIAFICDWYANEIERTIKEKHGITNRMSISYLSKIKASTKSLQEESSRANSALLGDPKAWWHLDKERELEVNSHNNRDALEKSVRLAAGKLASILVQYGLLSTTDRELWRESSNPGAFHTTGRRSCYPYRLNWASSMDSLMQRYEELQAEAMPVALKLQLLKIEKAQNEALERWNTS